MAKSIRAMVFGLALIIGTAGLTSCTPVLARDVVLDPERDTVVLLHGLGRSATAMWLLSERLEEAGYQVANIEYRSLRDTPEEILTDVSAQIRACCETQKGTLHFVGHSLGGLLIRAYLKDNRMSNLGHVVLMGSPNKGTELVDNLRDNWWFRYLGPTAKALGTRPDSFPNSLGRPDYRLGVIAGASESSNDALLPGPDDGMVSVESAKVEGMADFVLVETGHSAMRYNKDVAMQVVAFLKTGRFARQL